MDEVKLIQYEYNNAVRRHLLSAFIDKGYYDYHNEAWTQKFDVLCENMDVKRANFQRKFQPTLGMRLPKEAKVAQIRAWEYIAVCGYLELPIHPCASTIYDSEYSRTLRLFEFVQKTIDPQDHKLFLNLHMQEKLERFIDMRTFGRGERVSLEIKKRNLASGKFYKLFPVEVNEITGLTNVGYILSDDNKRGMYAWEYLYLCECFGLSINPLALDALEMIDTTKLDETKCVGA